MTLEATDRFLRKKKSVGNIDRGIVKDEGAIIYGAKSVNKQVKPHLRVHTDDYDILVEGDIYSLLLTIN